MESGRDLGKVGLGQAPPASSRGGGWRAVFPGRPQPLTRTLLTGPRCAVLRQSLECSGLSSALVLFSTCQHKTSLCPSETCPRAFMAAQA